MFPIWSFLSCYSARLCPDPITLLSNLFDRQAPGGKRAKQLGFRPGEIEPGRPVRAIEDDHLLVMNGRDVRTGLGCQQRERLPCPVWHGTPQAGEAEPILPCPGEFPLRFRRFRPGELEEMRGRDQATPFCPRVASPGLVAVGSRATGPAPPQLNQRNWPVAIEYSSQVTDILRSYHIRERLPRRERVGSEIPAQA